MRTETFFRGLIGVCALGLVMPALAMTPVNERRPLAASGHLNVNNIAGEVEVHVWDRAEVQLSGELGDGIERVDISGDGDTLRIEVIYPKRSDSSGGANLRLSVPAGISLSVQTVSADITVAGVRGKAQLESISGDIEAELGSPALKLRSVSGDVMVRAPASKIELNNVSGDTTLNIGGGELRAETVSGDLRIQAAKPVTQLELRSVSGDIDFDGVFAEGSTVTADTLSGEVTLALKAEPSATLYMKTFSGRLRSAFGGQPDARAKRYEATLGGGRGRIELTSFSGDIELTRR